MPRFSDLQLVLHSAAAGRTDGSLLPFPASINDDIRRDKATRYIPYQREFIDDGDYATREFHIATGRDRELGDALQPFLQRDADFGPREVGAGAAVSAIAEGRVLGGVAMKIDRHGIDVVAFVQSAKRGRRHDHFAALHRDAVILDVLHDFAPDDHDREAPQHFLDGVGNERGVGHQFTPVFGMPRQMQHYESEEIDDGIQPRDQHLRRELK